MDCPDDDTYAGFLQGLLPPERAAAIEGHLDVCPRCTELSAQFGRLYARPEEPAWAATAVDPRPDAGERWLAIVEALMACVHAVWALAVLPLAVQVWSTRVGPPGAGPAGPFAVAAAAYTAVWAPPGGVLALAAAWGLWRRRGWGRAAARWHALLSLPSVVLTPLAACALFELARLRRRDGG
jgi:hypothetical protein